MLKLFLEILLYGMGYGVAGLLGSFLLFWGLGTILNWAYGPYPPGSNPNIVLSMLWGLMVGPICAVLGIFVGILIACFK